jgi:two-component system, OmpR family, sensor kinase
MKGPKTLRSRMIVLFCSVVGVLLAVSYLAFWFLLAHEVSVQLNRELLEVARPVVAKLSAQADLHDLSQLEIPGKLFEVLDSTGATLGRSVNLSGPLNLRGIKLPVSEPAFGFGSAPDIGTVRFVVIPFQQSGSRRLLAVARPGLGKGLEDFWSVSLVIVPLSLLLTAGISSMFVKRSLAPITALTQHAALMADRVTNREGFWTPLPISSPDDELGQLAETINKLLQRVDSSVRTLRHFVTDASHELRTPLAVLHGETELLLSKPRSAEDYRKTLSGFDTEFKRLTRIVVGLFTLSVADAGQLRLTSEPVYLDEVLEEACALVMSRARSKNISLVLDIKPEISYLGDEAFLRQLFLIFLDNAIKYSSQDTRIFVGLGQDDGAIRASFQDEGIGISTKDLPFIFERFYRAAPSNNGDALQSGGLGLAIAQAIVHAQGGTIECESTLAVGSKFTVILPVNSTPSRALTSI